MAKPGRLPDFRKMYPEASEEVIEVLKETERKMQYQEYDLKAEQTIVDAKNHRVTVLSSREDPYERLVDMSIQFAEESLSTEEQVFQRMELEQLHRDLSSLSDEERYLIQKIFFNERTERDLAEELVKIKQGNEAVRQETTELSATNDLLREQADGLIENREKLMSDNKALEQRQKKLQQDIEKMADSKATLERNIHAYDEDAKWQLPEPAVLMGAKAYREKNAMPLVERLKDIVKSLTIKCINLMDQIKQLKAKVTKQAEDIDFYKSKVHQQYVKLEQLQEKADDFERVKQYVGVDKIDIIMTNARELERIAQSEKQQNKAYGMGR